MSFTRRPFAPRWPLPFALGWPLLIGALTALGLLLFAPARARAQGLEISVGERLGDTTTLLAGPTVSLVASIFFLHADPGCEAQNLTRITGNLRLPDGVALQNGAAPVQTIAPPAPSPGAPANGPAVINLTWPVALAMPVTYQGHLDVTAQSSQGRTCSASQDFKIVGVSHGPRLRVAGAVLYPNHIVAVVLARLPASGPVGSQAYSDALAENHDPRGELNGHTELDLITPFFHGRRLTINTASGFSSNGGSGVSCVDVARPKGFSNGTLRYRLHFNWNHDKGFSAVMARGRIRVTRSAVNPAERRCLGQEQLSSGQRPTGH